MKPFPGFVELRPRIYLMGFMGAGKSTEGQTLAKRLGYQFVETDRLVEQLAGKSIPEIFEQEGEAGFRKLEILVLQFSCCFTHTVIALGGGTPCSEEAWQWLRPPAFNLWLKKDPVVLIQNLRKHPGGRPLLNQMTDEALLDLYFKREPFYRRAQQCLLL